MMLIRKRVLSQEKNEIGDLIYKKNHAPAQFFRGAPSWIRTNISRLRSPVLYPLSYRGMNLNFFSTSS